MLGLIIGAISLAVFLLGGAGGHQSDAPVQADAPTVAEAASQEDQIPDGPATPYFASYRSLRLALPIESDSITLLAFHQASGENAMGMEALVPDTDMEALAARVQEGDYPTSAQLAEENDSSSDASSIWQGEALRLWRSNRRGEPNTAADIGAEPGTTVRSPVTGTVLAVREYDLYGRTRDYEIHITPDGWPEVDVVLIHVTDVLVSEGDRVYGGLSPIASVRSLSGIVDLQLAGYSGDGGDHVHMQLNELPDPAMLEFVGDS